MTHTPGQRYHALDAMRAVMMLLGLVIHSALCYATWTFGINSAYRDSNHTFILTGVIFLLHLFRMPSFFVVAGFFGSLLWFKYGGKLMLQNRIKRVFLPLCIGWIILFPATVLGAAFTILGGPKGVSTVIHQLRSGAVLHQHNMTFSQLLTETGLVHLWFLYFLMIFYFVMIALIYGLRFLPKDWKNTFRSMFYSFVNQPVGIIFLTTLSFLLMVTMHPANKDTTGIEGSTAFLPPLRVLGAYFIFFVYGWLLFQHQSLLTILSRRAWIYLSAGLFLSGLYALSILHPLFADHHVIQAGTAALTIWLLVYGVIGLFIRYGGQPNAILLYLSNASYWVYLVHLPLTLFLPGFLIGFDIPAIFKFLFVLIVATAVSLFSYHYLVRTSRIGNMLNGRKGHFVNRPTPSLKNVLTGNSTVKDINQC